MKNIRSLIIFLLLVVGGGITIGIMTAPGIWYDLLAKPPFNPPNWVFAPVWTILYIFIAVAGWRIWQHHRSTWTMKLWSAQLALNFIWSPAFFSAHRIDVALMIITALFITILLFIVTGWKKDRIAAGLFIPYAAWVGFASVLNSSLLYLNMPPS